MVDDGIDRWFTLLFYFKVVLFKIKTLVMLIILQPTKASNLTPTNAVLLMFSKQLEPHFWSKDMVTLRAHGRGVGSSLYWHWNV